MFLEKILDKEGKYKRDEDGRRRKDREMMEWKYRKKNFKVRKEIEKEII